MRIWHEFLIPKLCRQHLLAMWREGLGCYSIIVNNKNGYRNHPAVKEFENAPLHLWDRLLRTRHEMLVRGYNPKSLPNHDLGYQYLKEQINHWQTLEEQIAILKQKGCKCQL